MPSAGFFLIIVGTACSRRCRIAFRHDRRADGEVISPMILTRCTSAKSHPRFAPCFNRNFSMMRRRASFVSSARFVQSVDR